MDSVWIDTTPEEVYAAVSDVTRHGEWSVFTRACEWDDGGLDGNGSPRVGAHFTGHNSRPGRDWDTRSEVVAADPGHEFAWAVNGGAVRWGFEMRHAEGGTRLTQRWQLRPAGRELIRERFGEEGITLRTDDARTSIPTTLAAIKQVLEG